jgi:hypothetical protein
MEIQASAANRSTPDIWMDEYISHDNLYLYHLQRYLSDKAAKNAAVSFDSIAFRQKESKIRPSSVRSAAW